MKKFLFAILFAICFSAFSVQPLNAVSALDANADVTKITPLEVNEQSNFLNIYGINSFAKLDNNILYVLNNTLFVFNETTKTNKQLSYENVTKLEQTNNFAFVLSNGEIVVLNKQLKQVNIRGFAVNCDIFNVSESNEQLQISYLFGSTLGYVVINKNMEIIIDRSQNVSLLNASAICIINSSTYVVYSDNNVNKLAKIDNTTFEKTDIQFTYMNSTNLDAIDIDGVNYLLLTSSHHSTFSVLLEDDNSLTRLSIVLVASSATPSFLTGDIAEFTDVKVVNNNILVCDSLNGTIQSFELVNNNISNPKIILASKGYELGRFNNVNSLQIPSNNQLYVADTSNNRIQLIEENNVSAIMEINNSSFEQPKSFITTNNIDFYVLFGNKVTSINKTGTENYSIVENGIIDIAVTENNELFALTETKVLKASGETFETVLSSNFYENSKIVALNNGLFAITNNNYIQIYNESFSSMQTITINGNVLDVEVDYYQNLYALTTDAIVKVELKSDNKFYVTPELTLPTKQITCFALNKVNGHFVLFDNENFQLLKLESSYASNLVGFEHNTNVYDPTLINTIYKLGTIVSNTYVSTFPHSVNCETLLNKNSNVYVIDETLSNYYYCLYNVNNTIKFGYVKKDCLSLSVNEIGEHKKIETIYKNVKIYKYPTILKDETNANFIVETVGQNKMLNAINTNLISLDNSKYYAVMLENGSVGYVNASDVKFYDNSEIKPLPNTNAKIYSVLKTVKLLSSPNTNAETVLELKNNYKIYVENFDENKDFTYVTYINENKQEFSGYVETKFIVLTTHNAHYTSAYVLLGVAILLIIAGIIIYVKQKKSE